MPKFRKLLRDELARRSKLPKATYIPHATYNETGDLINVFFNDKPAYVEQITPTVHVYKSMDTHEIVGCKILDVKQLVNP